MSFNDWMQENFPEGLVSSVPAEHHTLTTPMIKPSEGSSENTVTHDTLWHIGTTHCGISVSTLLLAL